MRLLNKKNFVFLVIILLFFIFGLYSIESKTDFLANIIEEVEKPPEKLPNPPAVVKAVYVTGWSAGSKRYLNYLDELLKTTQINALVIDIKDVSGNVLYKTHNLQVRKYGNYVAAIGNIKALITELHNKGIYLIARQVVFKDYNLAQDRPDLAVFDKTKTQDKSNPVLWQDKNGMLWLDPVSKEVQEYNIAIAKEALALGFDEVNFDYIRFPSDGKLKDMGFPFFDPAKTTGSLVVKDFFKKIRESIPNDKISVDLFGLTTINTDDLGVGQVFEDAFEYFDYVSPMLYPSHYALGFLGYQNPAKYPYQVVKYSMDNAVLKRKAFDSLQTGEKKLAKVRPWLQDFDLGANYDADMIKQEIKAVEDSMGDDFNGFMLWNPLNLYTKDAILKEDYER